jgi:hypothetical protein
MPSSNHERSTGSYRHTSTRQTYTPSVSGNNRYYPAIIASTNGYNPMRSGSRSNNDSASWMVPSNNGRSHHDSSQREESTNQDGSSFEELSSGIGSQFQGHSSRTANWHVEPSASPRRHAPTRHYSDSQREAHYDPGHSRADRYTYDETDGPLAERHHREHESTYRNG